jgi:ketosteroid isomerase-like protein
MKKIKQISFFLIGIFLFGCVSDKSKDLEEKQAKNVALIKQLYQYFNQHDWEKMAILFTENTTFYDPSLGNEPVRQTRKDFVAKYKELEKMIPDVHDGIVNIYPSGEKVVVVEFVATGTLPNKEKLKLPICDVFTIENGLIVKNSTYYDNQDVPTETPQIDEKEKQK